MPELPVETMILRFRDLVTHTGETIEFHKQIITEKGYTWWGWWHKSGETISKALTPLLDIAKAEGLWVFLLDTGTSKFYRAKCIDMSWDGQQCKEMLTPEESCTPEYYRKRKNLAWWKLSEITEPIEENLIKEYTYCQVDDLFVEGSSRYTRFYGKTVYSVQELRQQERSIWFIRKRRKGDRANEITLFDAHEITPQHFLVERPLYSRRDTLVWVSDLHYGPAHAFHKSTAVEKSLGLCLEDTIKDLGVEPAGLVVTGDISDTAKPEEFKSASTDIFDWVERWRIDRYFLTVCPGNHDLAWSDDPSDPGKQIVHSVSDDSRKAFSNFYRDLFYIDPNEFISSGRRLILGGTMPVDLVSLNSSYLQQVEGAFQGHGFLGDKQLSDAADKMGWNDKGARGFRIALLHHHVFPVMRRESPKPHEPYSIVLDAGAFQEWIVKYKVDLVLHGHMHEPCHYAVERSISLKNAETHRFHVVGMGSTGACGSTNTVALLRFSPRNLQIEFLSIHSKNPWESIAKIEIPYERSST